MDDLDHVTVASTLDSIDDRITAIKSKADLIAESPIENLDLLHALLNQLTDAMDDQQLLMRHMARYGGILGGERVDDEH